MSANEDTLARLTFNATAMREYIGDDAKGVRLKIERGVVTLRPAKSLRGVDIIAIERRPRGTLADIGRGVLPRRLMQGLFKAGLSEKQPYFVLEPAGRGWFGIEHLAEHERPTGQAVMVVSDFDTPPLAIDMALWQRFLRPLSAGRAISEDGWRPVERMIRSAEQLVARKVRGRQSQERALAERLLAGVVRNAEKFLAWRERQPEFSDEVVGLLTRLGVELTEDEPEAVAVAPEPPAVAEEPVDEPVAPRARRPRRKSRSGAPVEPAWVLDVEQAPRDQWIVDEVTEEVTEVVVEVQADTDPGVGVAEEAVEGVPDTIQAAEESYGEPDPIVPEGIEPELEPPAQPDPEQETLDQAILTSWERHEDMEPSISTERLFAMVQDDTGADNARQVEALIRAGWPVPHED